MTETTLTHKEQLESTIQDLDQKISALKAQIEDLPRRREEAEDLKEFSERYELWASSGGKGPRPANPGERMRLLERSVVVEETDLRKLEAERAEATAALYALRRAEVNEQYEEALARRDALLPELKKLKKQYRALDEEAYDLDRRAQGMATQEFSHRNLATQIRQSLEASK